MKSFAICFGVIVAIVLESAWAQEAQPKFRTWTDSRGREAELAFLGLEHGKLRMQSPDGREFLLALDQLAVPEQDALLDGEVERAITLSSEGHQEEAASLLKELTGIAPQYASAFLWLGKMEAAQDDWTAAADAYKSYAKLLPDDVEGPRETARAYAKAGNKELAEFWYKRALEVDPTNVVLRAEAEGLDGEQSQTAASSQASAPPLNQTPSPGATPAGPAPAAASGEETQPFWRQGLVGLVGGRSVWWGRLIALTFFTLALFGGVLQMAGTYKIMLQKSTLQTREQAGCSALFGSIFGFSFMYILYWGVPAGGQWLILVAVVVVFSVLAAGAAASQS